MLSNGNAMIAQAAKQQQVPLLSKQLYMLIYVTCIDTTQIVHNLLPVSSMLQVVQAC